MNDPSIKAEDAWMYNKQAPTYRKRCKPKLESFAKRKSKNKAVKKARQRNR